MKKRKKVLIAAAIAVAAMVIWFLVRPPKPAPIELETAFAERMTLCNSVTATGTVEPVTEVEVGTQVSGIIDKLYADYNDVVKAGQLIAEMDKVTLQADLESARAELASSKTEYEYRTNQLNSSNLSYSEILRLEDTFNNMIEVEQKNKEAAKEEKEVEEPILRELVKLGKLANEIDAEEARTKIKKEIEQLGTFYVTELFKIKTTIKEELILPNPLDKLKMDCIRRISEMENEISQMKENNTLEADLQKLQRSLRS